MFAHSVMFFIRWCASFGSTKADSIGSGETDPVDEAASGLMGWLKWIVILLAIVIAVCNLPIETLLPVQDASLDQLASAELYTIDANYKKFQAGDLWKHNGAVIMAVRRPGCSLCREEAQELSKIKSELDRRGVNLYGIVHETRGVKEFQPFFKGEIYLDSRRVFYGPKERWMSYWGFFRWNFWTNFRRAQSKGVPGNLEGEGRLLGGVYVLGPGSEGILLQHHETEWGHHVNISQIRLALDQIKPAKATHKN